MQIATNLFERQIMSIEELAVLLLGLIPFLNTGLLIFTIDLVLGKLGFQITRKDYKRKPVKSLLFGLCLIVVSSLISLFIQSQMSEFQPLLAFIILLGAYLALTQT